MINWIYIEHQSCFRAIVRWFMRRPCTLRMINRLDRLFPLTCRYQMKKKLNTVFFFLRQQRWQLKRSTGSSLPGSSLIFSKHWCWTAFSTDLKKFNEIKLNTPFFFTAPNSAKKKLWRKADSSVDALLVLEKTSLKMLSFPLSLELRHCNVWPMIIIKCLWP